MGINEAIAGDVKVPDKIDQPVQYSKKEDEKVTRWAKSIFDGRGDVTELKIHL